jgi:hypothetical protein
MTKRLMSKPVSYVPPDIISPVEPLLVPLEPMPISKDVPFIVKVLILVKPVNQVSSTIVTPKNVYKLFQIVKLIIKLLWITMVG